MRKLLCVILLFCGCAVEYPEPGPTPDPPKPVPTPTPDPDPRTPQQKAWVESVEKYEDPELEEFYAAFADIVRRDSEIIVTTGHIREAHVRAGRLMFQNRRDSNPELAGAVDAAFSKALGLQNIALTETKREEVVLFLEAMAWAFK